MDQDHRDHKDHRDHRDHRRRRDVPEAGSPDRRRPDPAQVSH